MPAMYEVSFAPDGAIKQFVGSRGNYYEFHDGSHIDLETTPVWCHDCRKIAHGEQIESLEEIDKQLADLNDPASMLYGPSPTSALT